MSELYVYYKLRPEQAGTARAAFAAAAAGLSVRLLQRDAGQPDDTGLITWMEIHSGPEAEATVQRLALALAPCLAGPRHLERFSPLAG